MTNQYAEILKQKYRISQYSIFMDRVETFIMNVKFSNKKHLKKSKKLDSIPLKNVGFRKIS